MGSCATLFVLLKNPLTPLSAFLARCPYVGFGAGGAPVGLLTRVDPLVFHQAVVAAESLKADVTLVGLLPRVGPHVPLQVLRVVEQLGTEGTRVLPESIGPNKISTHQYTI